MPDEDAVLDVPASLADGAAGGSEGVVDLDTAVRINALIRRALGADGEPARDTEDSEGDRGRGPGVACNHEPLLQTRLQRCDDCHGAVLLVATVRGTDIKVCASCWKIRDCPWPVPGSALEVHEKEVVTRKTMQNRRGADAHMVRAGRS